jgi:hypothetical protein
MWFHSLTGFDELSPDQVRANLELQGAELCSRVNGKTWRAGTLETPSLAELRTKVHSISYPRSELALRSVVADVSALHTDPANAGALFQVASQFNLLEMTSPDVTPESGVGIYEYDRTQGPACAIAAGAGTIYRNYFANVNGQIGQSETNQIDCLADIGAALGNAGGLLWKMRNGYVLPTSHGLTEISGRLRALSEREVDEFRSALRIGIQWDTEVTLDQAGLRVSQAYCSALPISYCSYPRLAWKSFATLILEAAYEATVCAAIINSMQSNNNTVYLTLLGGGVFGNDFEWIMAAMHRALLRYQDADLDVGIVSRDAPKLCVSDLIQQWNSR